MIIQLPNHTDNSVSSMSSFDSFPLQYSDDCSSALLQCVDAGKEWLKQWCCVEMRKSAIISEINV